MAVQSQSLARRLFTMQMIPLGAALGFAFVLISAFFIWKATVEEKQRFLTLMKVFAQNLESPLMFQDNDEVKRLAGSLSLNKDVDSAAVYTLKQSAWIEVIKGRNPLVLAEIAGHAESSPKAFGECDLTFCTYFFTVIHDQEKLATLLVRTSMSNLMHSVIQMIIVYIVAMIGAIVISALVARRFARVVTSPVAQFLSVVKSISASENYHLRVTPLTWQGSELEEISDLASEFDVMIERIAAREMELAALNKSLEGKVEERTRELEAERAKGMESSRLASLGEMAAGIAHEINNPMAIIRASAEQVDAKGVADGDESLRKYASRIITVADRVAKIVKGLRSYARDGRDDPFADFSVRAMILGTVDFCQARFQNHGVQLKVPDVDPELKIFGREVQISQVLLNLLNNAFDSINESKKTGWVEVEIRDSGDYLELHVIDSGPGVPKGLEWKIMQPFFTTKAVGKGTGLGLSISRSIMEAHRGQLVLDTNSKNTRFVLRFLKKVTTAAA